MPTDQQRIASSAQPTWLILGAFAIVYIVWGSTYLAIRFAVATLPPFLLAAIRFLVAGGGLYLVALWSQAQRPTLNQCLQAAGIGCFLLVGGNGLVTWAQQTVPSGVAALVVATVPLWMVGLDTITFQRRRHNRVVWFGLLLGLVGVGVLLGPMSTPESSIDLWGAVALLSACFFWSVGSLASRDADLPTSFTLTTSLQMVAGGMFLLCVGSLLGEWSAVDWDAVSAKSIWSLAYLIVFGGMIAYSAYCWLLRVCDVSVVSTYAYVNPVIAVLLGASLGAETLTTGMLLGAALIVVSVVVVVTYRNRKGT